MTDLLPCPLCGAAPDWSCYPTLALVECLRCKANGIEIRAHGHGPESSQQTQDGIPWTVIFDTWNRRAPTPAGWQPITKDFPILGQQVIAKNATNPDYPPCFVTKISPAEGSEFADSRGCLYYGFTHFFVLPSLPPPA